MAAEPIGLGIQKVVNELWWMGVLEGTLALFFGVTAIFWPGLTLLTLVYLFSAFVLSVGIVQTLVGLTSINSRDTWWLTLLVGLVMLGAGIYLMRHPAVSFGTFITVIGLSLLARGFLDMVRVFADRLTGAPRILSVLAGAASIVAGIIILVQPVAGGVAFVWILGLYALIFGSLTIAISLGLHEELQRMLSPAARAPAPATGRRRKAT